MIFNHMLKRSVIRKGTADVYDDFWYTLTAPPVSSGKSVTKDTGMRNWAVYACVSIISETLAQLPLKLKRPRQGGGTEDAIDHPLFDLMKNYPNPEMSSFNWREAQQANILGYGNSYGWIERSRYEVRAVWPISPNAVTVKRNKGELENYPIRKIYYEVKEGTKLKNYDPKDILHVSGFSFDGIIGESVITNYAREVIGNGIALNEFLGKFLKNGVHVTGAFEHPGTWGDNLGKFKEAVKKRWSGSENAGIPLLLEKGLKFNQYKISLVDQQFLEHLKLNPLQTCGVFKVPPTKIGLETKQDSYNNTEQKNKSFIDTTMMPWANRWEQALNFKLLTKRERREGYFFKFNFDALLRPDAKTRAEIDQIEWSQGVPKNKLRERDDLPPIEGGDISYVPLNFIDANSNREDQQDNRSIEVRSNIVTARDRIAGVWSPLIRKSADKLVRREAKAVKREARKHLENRAQSDFKEWINEFYRKLPEIIQSELGPVFRGYMEQMVEQVQKEIGHEITEAEFNTMAANFIEYFSLDWASSSSNQLLGLLEGEDSYLNITQRAGEWEEKRAGKVEMNEIVAIAGAVAVLVFSSAGVAYRWRIKGKTCAYCRKLEGRVVNDSGTFANPGDVISTDEGEMKVRQTKSHPPLHRGCDCYLSA